MIKVEENYPTEFYYLSLLWRYDHLKIQLCYAFLCGQYLHVCEQGAVDEGDEHAGSPISGQGTSVVHIEVHRLIFRE